MRDYTTMRIETKPHTEILGEKVYTLDIPEGHELAYMDGEAVRTITRAWAPWFGAPRPVEESLTVCRNTAEHAEYIVVPVRFLKEVV